MKIKYELNMLRNLNLKCLDISKIRRYNVISVLWDFNKINILKLLGRNEKKKG